MFESSVESIIDQYNLIDSEITNMYNEESLSAIALLTVIRKEPFGIVREGLL